jgi:hypothetical protein
LEAAQKVCKFKSNQTLVFLTARKYFENERLDVGIFEDLWQSLIQNEQ